MYSVYGFFFVWILIKEKNMYNQKICFCFIVRNGDSYLQENIHRILQLANKFSAYKVLYLENDSTDTTRQILNSFHNEHFYGTQLQLDGKHSTELCTRGEPYNCLSRTQRLAALRQKVLSEALEWDSDVIVMLDMDFVDFQVTEFFNMMTVLWGDSKMDGIFGMSVLQSNTKEPYDCGAVRPLHLLIQIVSGQQLVRVQSAFSGFGVYRTKSIRDNKAFYDTTKSGIEHISFNSFFDSLHVYTPFRPIYEGAHQVPYVMHFGTFYFVVVSILLLSIVSLFILGLFVVGIMR